MARDDSDEGGGETSTTSETVVAARAAASLIHSSPQKSMDGLVMQSAMTHDSDFTNRCIVPGDCSTTLWQFLLELLKDGGYPHLIAWTNNHGEFKLLNAEGVAQLWGKRKGKEHMNYDKLSRALRYYYDKNIIKKVIGQKFVYRFMNLQDLNLTPHNNNDSMYHSYRPNGMKSLLGQAMPPPLGIDLQNIKKEDPMSFMTAIPTSTALPSTPVQQMNTSDLMALNMSGVSSTSNDTPSPTDSSCSPNSMCSSSGVSSAVPTIASPPGPSSRPGSVHSDDQNGGVSRKRRATPPPIKVERDESSQPAVRRSRPENLDLASTQFLNPTLPMAISPLHVMQQMSPFLIPQQMQLYALASASICGPNSPLFSGLNATSPFRSPLSTPKMAQVFQFPPVSSTATAVSALANLMNSPAILSAGLNANSSSIFKFPTNDVLKTPTLPMLSQLATKPVHVNSDS